MAIDFGMIDVDGSADPLGKRDAITRRRTTMNTQ
jgi:hypothetical protein